MSRNDRSSRGRKTDEKVVKDIQTQVELVGKAKKVVDNMSSTVDKIKKVLKTKSKKKGKNGGDGAKTSNTST